MEKHDVLVIGSGYGGTIPATRLAEVGMDVLVLERGERLETKNLQQSDDFRYIQRIVDVVISSENVAYRSGKLVGGASIPMDGAHFRMPQKSFESTDAKGRRVWPEGFSRAEMDPYYERVESMLQVRQFSWNEIPRGGGLFAKMLSQAGASCERARMNYTDCVHCGFCAQGCTFDKKMTLLHTYIPQAEAAGAEFRQSCDVQSIEPMGTGYLVHYVKDKAAQEVWAQHVIVACGGIHTPALLLRSASTLPKLSAHVGEHFNINGDFPYVGILPPEFDQLDQYACYKGMDNPGMMSFHWFESDGMTFHPGGGLEPSLFAATLEAQDSAVLPKRAWGMEYKRFVESVYPHRVIAFTSLGIVDGHAAVAAGSSGPNVVSRDRTALDAYLDRVDAIVADMAKRSGVTIVPALPRKLAGMGSAHLLSACRMAESASDGVVDPSGEVFGYPNLWICDASSLPGALGVNPALTISALAERTAEAIIARG